ncbi:MAG: hypothetical protein JWR50_3179 [Mucilaginibacter sp.]|nr:hypothetical protein [Mucilaginibacter sp.]
MDIKIANKLYDEGILTELFKAGFVSAKIFDYREIYLWVDAQCKSRHISQEKAVLEAQLMFKKSRPTIYKAIYIFK